MEGVGELISGNVPGFGHAGDRIEGFWIPIHQAFEQRHDHAQLGLAGRNRGINRFDLGVVDEGKIGGGFWFE